MLATLSLLVIARNVIRPFFAMLIQNPDESGQSLGKASSKSPSNSPSTFVARVWQRSTATVGGSACCTAANHALSLSAGGASAPIRNLVVALRYTTLVRACTPLSVRDVLECTSTSALSTSPCAIATARTAASSAPSTVGQRASSLSPLCCEPWKLEPL